MEVEVDCGNFSMGYFDNDELICSYRNCRHKLIDHDGKKCKCRHKQSDISVGFQPKAVIFFNIPNDDALEDKQFRTF